MLIALLLAAAVDPACRITCSKVTHIVIPSHTEVVTEYVCAVPRKEGGCLFERPVRTSVRQPAQCRITWERPTGERHETLEVRALCDNPPPAATHDHCPR